MATGSHGRVPAAKKKIEAKPATKKLAKKYLVPVVALTPTQHLERTLTSALASVRAYESTPETENYRQACETKLLEAQVMLQHMRPKE